MKIVVIGGTGLIGSKVVTQLGERGHEAIAASPDTGVNTPTGEGLGERALLPGPDARLAETRFSDWFQQQLAVA